ncbi:unnamed protein product [Clonostachys chloroleuca]|uniref:chitinase n=1 Tax=Clonostachys chloroleuca TaxID=1926264 RepID=A0AA35MEI9_9HYPO|nr:unnamed protein product [Clonostachys chloroleuca]
MLTASLIIALLAPVALAEQADLLPRGCPDGTVTTVITSLTTTAQSDFLTELRSPWSDLFYLYASSNSWHTRLLSWASDAAWLCSKWCQIRVHNFHRSIAYSEPDRNNTRLWQEHDSDSDSNSVAATSQWPQEHALLWCLVGFANSKNRSIYGQKFRPQDMSVNKVSHILYAFGDIGSDGSVISADPWADYQIRYSGDSQESSGSNAYGNVKQLYLLKQKYRNLKTLLSIGGYTYSQQGKFQAAANTAAGRQRFASSAVQLMSDWGFDGLDIDWEYPENQADASNFVLLLQACRAALDKYAKDNNQNYRYPLTIAVSAGPEKYKLLNMKAMDQYVDTWNLMAYDYAGSWDTTTGHAANLFYSSANPQSTKFNTDQAVKDYIKGGVSPSKIVLGLPLYGRSFLNTVAQPGQPYQGVASNTGSDLGVWLYRDLPRQGAQVKIDTQAGAAWSYDATTKELVSFDNVPVGLMKAGYIRKQGLGGAMFWEAAGDKTGGESLVGAVGDAMGSLELSNNMLDYPQSRYSNIRNKMKV